MAVPGSRSGMSRAAFLFASVASALTLLAIALPHDPSMDELGLALTALGAAGLAAVAVVGYDRLPGWAFHAGCAFASVLATAAIHFWDTGSAYGPLPYLWPTVFAAYYLPRAGAAVQLALIGILFAAELIARDPGYAPVADWAATMGTLASAVVLVSIARERLMALVSNLTDAALRDPLTGLLNRRGFEAAFDLELERARRAGQPLSVIVGDLDTFKALNDTYGHGAGDEALRRVGRTLEAGKRSWDTAARVGGEEFALIAPDTDEHGAYILAERLRTAIERHFAAAGPCAQTMSFGIACHPLHGETGAALLIAADQALYAAKRLGRNRSVISSAEVTGILAGQPRNAEEPQLELGALLSLAEALDLRDSGTTSHCQRVGRYSEQIARELGLSPESIEQVRLAGILHDVGRVGVPDDLIAKAGPLSEEEWHWVRSHPEIGARMLETTAFTDMREWVHAHHERPDGTGYPDGLEREEVPLEAAIIGAVIAS
jgi:diguanylate cyclase (GGDEF)-like protein/putative nucleotidyltransferase with HDIG domain